MKNIAEWIFINTLFAFASSGAVFLRLFLPYPFTSEAFKVFSYSSYFSYEKQKFVLNFVFSALSFAL